MSTSLNRVAELAHADPTQRFLSLAHLLTPEALLAAFSHLRKDASAGVDDVTYADYEEHAPTSRMRTTRNTLRRTSDSSMTASRAAAT